MRRLAAALILAMMLPVLTGCIADQLDLTERGGALTLDPAGLTEARFTILPAEAHWIDASSDDVKLFAKMWRPDVTEAPDWRAPIILVMTPYQGHDDREDPFDPTSRPSNPDYSWLIDHFVPRGYAVVFLDVRGTGDSGGCLEQTAAKQRQDGYDAVEHLAAFAWSNGKVGMYGRSYRAETQLGTAVLNPPSLTTIVPVASVAGQYEWNYYDGVPFTLHTLLGNVGYTATSSVDEVPVTPESAAQYPTRFSCVPEMFTVDPAHTGDWSAYWEARELRKLVDDIEHTSVLYVHGLQDWNVRPVALRDMWDEITTEKRLILGQWSHAFPDNGYGEEPKRTDWRATVHKWFDHELLGIDNAILDELPPVQVQDSSMRWRAERQWPPAGLDALTLHLTADGLAPVDTGELDPPLVFRENDEAFARANGVPLPSADTGEVRERLVFDSESFDQDVHIVGWPTLRMDIELFDGLYPDPDRETDAHFAANLYVVHPQDGAQWINAGYLSARHRNGVEDPQPVPEQQRIGYELRFHPQDTVVAAGSSLRLVLAGSDAATEVQGSFFGANLFDGALVVPIVPPGRQLALLDVPTE